MKRPGVDWSRTRHGPFAIAVPSTQIVSPRHRSSRTRRSRCTCGRGGYDAFLLTGSCVPRRNSDREQPEGPSSTSTRLRGIVRATHRACACGEQPAGALPHGLPATDRKIVAVAPWWYTVRNHNRKGEPSINIVACPGLGTHTGKMAYPEAARQMALAYRNSLAPPRLLNWRFADQRQDQIEFGGNSR